MTKIIAVTDCGAIGDGYSQRNKVRKNSSVRWKVCVGVNNDIWETTEFWADTIATQVVSARGNPFGVAFFLLLNS